MRIKLIEDLPMATSAELYQLSWVIDRLLADPRRIVQARTQLHAGGIYSSVLRISLMMPKILNRIQMRINVLSGKFFSVCAFLEVIQGAAARHLSALKTRGTPVNGEHGTVAACRLKSVPIIITTS